MIKKVFLLAFTAFLIAMAIPSSRARLQQEVFKPIMDDVNGRLVPSRLTTMADQLDFRLNRAEGFPGNWESWLRFLARSMQLPRQRCQRHGRESCGQRYVSISWFNTFHGSCGYWRNKPKRLL